MLAKADADGSNTLNWQEFLDAVLEQEKIKNLKQLKSAFEAFDSDGSGSIDSTEVKAVVKAFGQDLL